MNTPTQHDFKAGQYCTKKFLASLLELFNTDLKYEDYIKKRQALLVQISDFEAELEPEINLQVNDQINVYAATDIVALAGYGRDKDDYMASWTIDRPFKTKPILTN